MVEEVKNMQHLDEMLAENQLILLDFSAPWCGPCKAFTPIFTEYSEENSSTIKCVKVNIDNCQDIALKHNIRSIPSLVLIKGKTILDSKVGALDKQSLQKWVESKESEYYL